MLKQLTLLPATMAVTLLVGGCENGDFQGDVGEPDIQTEQPLETDADLEATDEFGQEPGVGEQEMFEEGQQGVLEDESELGEEGLEPGGVGADATTADPVDVPQGVNAPENETNQQQQDAQPSEPSAGEPAGEDADAVEEVPADSLPADQQGGQNQ